MVKSTVPLTQKERYLQSPTQIFILENFLEKKALEVNFIKKNIFAENNLQNLFLQRFDFYLSSSKMEELQVSHYLCEIYYLQKKSFSWHNKLIILLYTFNNKLQLHEYLIHSNSRRTHIITTQSNVGTFLSFLAIKNLLAKFEPPPPLPENLGYYYSISASGQQNYWLTLSM